MHDNAYIGGRSENNIKCVVHDDLSVTGFMSDFLFPSCGTYSVLSRSHSILVLAMFLSYPTSVGLMLSRSLK